MKHFIYAELHHSNAACVYVHCPSYSILKSLNISCNSTAAVHFFFFLISCVFRVPILFRAKLHGNESQTELNNELPPCHLSHVVF